jgi:hypothetical protein
MKFRRSLKRIRVKQGTDIGSDHHLKVACLVPRLEKEVKLQIYKGFIRPVLEYSSAARDPHEENLQDNLWNVQKRSARFISSNYEYEGVMTSILQD